MPDADDAAPLDPSPPGSTGPAALAARTHLAILFVDLSDSTRLSGVMEAETFAAMLDDVKRICRQAIQARRGILNQFQGDGLQAVFGHPAPTEHDGQHAVEAALEIHAGVRALRQGLVAAGAGDLSVHSGLHAGPALVRPGDDMSGHLELFGPVPGIAKHLSDLALADELLASEESLGPDLQQFDCEPTRHLAIKGRAQPLAVRRILALRPRDDRSQAHARRGLIPLLGREHELGVLNQWRAAAQTGSPVIGRVVAPAGQGKTRLVEAFLDHARQCGDRVLRGFGDADHNSLPLAPILQVLNALLALPPHLSPPQAQDEVEAALQALGLPALEAQPLCQALALDQRTQAIRPAERAALSQAIRRALCAAAQTTPTVVFIDDWHWTDDATRGWVHDLIAQGTGRLLVVVTTRPRESADLLLDAHAALQLGPLSDEAALASVRVLLPGADPFLARRIVDLSGGNPLYLEELCHFAQTSRTVEALPGGLRGPAWLEALIANRLARLAPAARHVLDCAAAIGTQVPGELLTPLCGLALDADEVKVLADEDLLFPSPGENALRFKHGITREVAYAAIGLETRRALHRRLAELIEAPGQAGAVELLAYHHAGAGNHGRAAHCSALAGDRAMAMSAIDRAKLHYRAALEATDRQGQQHEQYLLWRSAVRRYGMACVFDPGASDVAIFEQAVERGRQWQDAAGTAYAAYWLAYVHYALGATRPAIAACGLARDACQSAGDDELALQVAALHGQALAAQCHALALPALEAVAARATQSRPDLGARRPAPGVAYMLACRASLIADRDSLEAALPAFENALRQVPTAGHEVESSVLCLQSNALLWHGRWAEAAQAAQAALRVATRVRSVYLVAMSSALRAWADWQLHGRPDALDELEAATAWLDANDKRLFIALNHGRLAQAQAERGQTAMARRHAARALARWRQGDPFGAPCAWRTLALLAWQEGRVSLAQRRLARADVAASARGARHEMDHNDRCRQRLQQV